MQEKQTSFMVSSRINENFATEGCNSATGIATGDATSDLLVAAKRVLERHKCNHTRNQHATGQLQAGETGPVAQLHVPMECNHATAELRRLIGQVSDIYGGDDPQFLDTYCEEL